MHKNYKCKKECKCEKLLDSTKTFSNGTHYGIEVSGIETAEILTAVVDDARKLGIPIHRAIATVQGSAFYSNKQLKSLVRVAAKNKVEVIICPNSLARMVIENPNKILDGLNFRNTDEVNAYIGEILRCVALGFRGFLVWQDSMLVGLSDMRRRKELPPETIFKVSTFANSANKYDFLFRQKLGADTVNVVNSIGLEELSEIRAITDVVMDIHITFWRSFLGKDLKLVTQPYNRIEEAPEIARICSPVYFKFEAGTPGIGVYNINPNWTFKDLAEHKREDVWVAASIVKAIKEKYPYLKLSGWGPDYLRVPVV